MLRLTASAELRFAGQHRRVSTIPQTLRENRKKLSVWLGTSLAPANASSSLDSPSSSTSRDPVAISEYNQVMNGTANKGRHRRFHVESLERREMLAGDGIDGSPDTSLRMIVRDNYLPGVPVLVRVQLENNAGEVDRQAWDESIVLSSSTAGVTINAEPLELANGMGSTLVMIEGGQDFMLQARWGEQKVERQLTALIDPTVQTISGRLESDTTLSGVVHVTDDLIVPEGRHLEVEAGTLVLLDGVPSARDKFGAEIRVEGSMRAAGTAEDPITFTAADPARPWGEIDVAGGTVEVAHSIVTRAGSAPRGGHTSTGPALRLRDNGSLTLDQSTVADISGKIMQATSGLATMTDTLLTRAVMGPEIKNTGLAFHDSWIIRMAGQYHHNGTVDDNDGIYLHSQQDGQSIQLIGAVVAGVQDDGIDTLGSDVLIRDTIVRDATDKAISVFYGEARIEKSLLVNSGIGVETKGTGNATPHTIIDRTTIANISEIGVFAKDKGAPDPDVVITYDITNSIIHVLPGADPLKTDYDPVDLHVNYTLVQETWSYDGSGTGNVEADPLFADASNNNFRLTEDSPAIDAGDPNSAQDDDATRADLGYYWFDQRSGMPGDFNQDDQVDAQDVDRLCMAIRNDSADELFDLNGDDAVNGDDMQHMIGEILQTSAGDANLDGEFNSSDLVAIFAAGHYEDLIEDNSGWAQGDWDCDGDFTTSDLLVAFQGGTYKG